MVAAPRSDDAGQPVEGAAIEFRVTLREEDEERMQGIAKRQR
jgi:hypothetical protein